jgi:hypothetical protein
MSWVRFPSPAPCRIPRCPWKASSKLGLSRSRSVATEHRPQTFVRALGRDFTALRAWFGQKLVKSPVAQSRGFLWLAPPQRAIMVNRLLAAATWERGRAARPAHPHRAPWAPTGREERLALAEWKGDAQRRVHRTGQQARSTGGAIRRACRSPVPSIPCASLRGTSPASTARSNTVTTQRSRWPTPPETRHGP